MLNKSARFFSKRFASVANLRLARNLQLQSHEGYLHNLGSEPLTHTSLGDVVAKTAHRYPGRVAIRSVHEDISMTYEDLLNQADSLGCALRDNGFEKGDRLGIWSHNCVGWVVALLAAARVGLISVFINHAYEMNELSFCIKKTKMKGLLIGDTIKNRDYIGRLNKMLPELQTSKEGSLTSQIFPNLSTIMTLGKEKINGVSSVESLINSYKNNYEVSKYGKEIKPQDGSICLLTSGTTGDPKAVIDSHLGIVNNTYFSGKRLLLDEEHQIVCLQAPLFHALGSVVTLISALQHGSTIVIAGPVYNVAANINALCAEKCTVITGTPTMYVDMLSHIANMGQLPIKLRIAIAGGAPCSPRLIKQMNEQMKVDYVSALYGLTETTACVFQSLPGDSIDVVSEYVGYLGDHTEVKVVDEKGEMVPFGVPGELMVRAYSNMICYWDEPEKTKKTLREDGWLYTGDKFTLSPDGYGRIVGRFKDIIIRGGENIAPKEIEDQLTTHPDIVECQVIGVADERLGEELCAVVLLKEGAKFTLDNMATHLSGKLARYKIPRLLKTVNEFPRTASGKIQSEDIQGVPTTADVEFTNGFLVSLRNIDIVRSTVQQVWVPFSGNTTSVEVRATMRMLDAVIGYDVVTKMEKGIYRSTGTIQYPEIQFPFVIAKNLFTDDITVTVSSTLVRTTNLMHLTPENELSKVVTVLFDWNSPASSILSWATDIFAPITLELVKNEIEFPRVCYNCNV